MTRLVWDDTGKRFFETGIDKCVLYLMDTNGAYPLGVPWNGLTAITESPSGAEPGPLYGDNIKYLTLMSAEEFAATLEAYTYPKEFGICDGSAEFIDGIGGWVSQQPRKKFGLVYRTKLGNDVSGQDLGYKLHLIYGCMASPSEKAYASVNDSPEAITFSWDIATTPTNVIGFRPTSLLIVDSSQATANGLAILEDELFGDVTSGVARLPLPDEVNALLNDGKFVFLDHFPTNILAGSVNGTSAKPGRGKRLITDVELNIDIKRNSIRGFYQPASPVWGESKAVFTQNDGSGFSRAIGRTLVGLVTMMDQVGLAVGWSTASNTGDPRTVGHGWLTQGEGQGGAQYVIEPGRTVTVSQNRTIRTSQYLIAIALNDTGAYILVSSFANDNPDDANTDYVPIPQYPLARIIWVSAIGSASPLYPYISGIEAASGGYPPGHILQDPRIVDVPTWISADFLAAFADRCNRANSNTTIGAGWIAASGKVFGISSNKVYCVSGTGFEAAYHATSLTGDGIWECDITVPADWNGSNYSWGMIIRAVDSTNYIRVWNNGGSYLLTQSIVNGNFGATILNGGFVWVAGQTYHLTVMTIGNMYLHWVDGVVFATQWTADAGNYFLTGNGIGPYGANANGTTIRWDNFIATPHTVSLPDIIGQGAIPSVWTPGATLAQDSFTGTNGTHLNVHTAESGGTWEEINANWTIQSNRATAANMVEPSMVLQNVGASDYECSVDLIAPGAINNDIFNGIIVRYTDSNNFVTVRSAAAAGQQAVYNEIEMWTTINGVSTLSSKVLMDNSFVANTTRRMTVRVKSSLLEVFLDGYPRACRILPEGISTGTKCGLYRGATDSGVVFDNWMVKVI